MLHAGAYLTAKENVLEKKEKEEIFKGTCYVTKYAIMQINEYAASYELRYISVQFHCFLHPIIIANNGASRKCHLRVSAKQYLWQCTTGAVWKPKVRGIAT